MPSRGPAGRSGDRTLRLLACTRSCLAAVPSLNFDEVGISTIDRTACGGIGATRSPRCDRAPSMPTIKPVTSGLQTRFRGKQRRTTAKHFGGKCWKSTGSPELAFRLVAVVRGRFFPRTFQEKGRRAALSGAIRRPSARHERRLWQPWCRRRGLAGTPAPALSARPARRPARWGRPRRRPFLPAGLFSCVGIASRSCSRRPVQHTNHPTNSHQRGLEGRDRGPLDRCLQGRKRRHCQRATTQPHPPDTPEGRSRTHKTATARF